jgi:hypothetical protein
VRRGKSGETAAKLHGGRPALRTRVRPAVRRMSLSRLNFKVGPGAGKRIALVCYGRSNKRDHRKRLAGASERESGRKGEDHQ